MVGACLHVASSSSKAAGSPHVVAGQMARAGGGPGSEFSCIVSARESQQFSLDSQSEKAGPAL